MFKRIITSAAILAGMAIPVSAGVATIAPGIAHATAYSCDNGTEYFNNEDSSYMLRGLADRQYPNNDIFASDSFGTNYPVLVGPAPTGQWTNFGYWNICWTTLGQNATGYYGEAEIQNVATGFPARVADAGTDTAVYANGNLGAVFDFQCNGADIYMYFRVRPGYWTSYDPTYTNIYLQNVSSNYQDEFYEVGSSPRFC